MYNMLHFIAKYIYTFIVNIRIHINISVDSYKNYTKQDIGII